MSEFKKFPLWYGAFLLCALAACLCLLWVAATTEFAEGSPASPDIVVMTIAYESSGEPFEAQVQVASVIRTRAIERGLTPEQVCLQWSWAKRKGKRVKVWQFSCWGRKDLKPRTTAELRKARRAWEASKTMKHDVNLYHDTSVTPWWAKSDKVKFVRQVGRLKFYKEIR